MATFFSRAIAQFYTRPYLTVFVAIATFWFLLLLSSGTLFSGFHFMDDHDFVAIHYALTSKKMSFLEVIIQWLHDDHQTGRFRPFYFINRIFQTQLLGINVPLWAFYTALQGILTTFFCFIFATLLNFTLLESLLFAAITVIGAQSAVWWMLGPSETIGTFLLSVCLIFVALSAKSVRWRPLYLGLAILYALLMSLCKESYILMLPAIALLLVWLHQKEIQSWKQTIRQTALPGVILLLIFLAELVFVKYVVGTTPDIGYAGFEGFKLDSIWRTFQSLFWSGGGWIILLSVLLLLYEPYQKIRLKLGYLSSWKLLLQALVPLMLPVMIFGAIALPQVILYAKSGISQRYIFPGIFAFSLLIIYLHQQVNRYQKELSKFILLLIAVSLSFKLHGVWQDARIFALEGQATNRLLTTIIVNTTPNDSILLVTNPVVYYEWNYSIKKYLNFAGDRQNLYVHSFQPWDLNSFGTKLRSFYNGHTLDTLEDKANLQCIVIFPLLNNAFLKQAEWFERSQYQEFVFGNFNRNFNPNSEINLYCKK